MKKNYVMRIAAVLLVLVLLSTCVVSGTFAKYVTNGTATDKAQVAKWGVTVTAPNQDQLFASSYDGNNVKATGSYDVVAPGTEGALADFQITGSPEVAVRVTYSANLALAGWALADTSVYCPLVINVNGTEYKIDAINTTTAELELAVEAAIAAVTASYAVGETINDTLVVTWSWAYNGGNDSADTYLGNQASIGNAPTIQLDVTCTVTQID